MITYILVRLTHAKQTLTQAVAHSATALLTAIRSHLFTRKTIADLLDPPKIQRPPPIPNSLCSHASSIDSGRDFRPSTTFVDPRNRHIPAGPVASHSPAANASMRLPDLADPSRAARRGGDRLPRPCGRRPLQPGDVVLLEGPLGAGKTAFARAALRHLAGDPALEVPSPSYPCCNPTTRRLVQCITTIYGGSTDRPTSPSWAGRRRARTSCWSSWPDRLGPLRPADALTIMSATPGRRARGRAHRLAGPACGDVMRVQNIPPHLPFLDTLAVSARLDREHAGRGADPAADPPGSERARRGVPARRRRPAAAAAADHRAGRNRRDPAGPRRRASLPRRSIRFLGSRC